MHGDERPRGPDVRLEAFALAMGVVFLGVVRFSADRGSVGILAALGIVFVAIACALHTAAILRDLALLAPLVRGLAIAIS